MTGKLIKGEVTLKKYDAGFTITTQRLIQETAPGLGERSSFAVPLSDIGLCEVVFESKPWLLFVAVFLLLIGMVFDPVYELNRDPVHKSERGVIFMAIPAAYLVWRYFRTRRARLTIWAGAARKDFGFPGTSIEMLEVFVQELHAARLGCWSHESQP